MISFEPPETKVVNIGDHIEGLGTVLDPDDDEINNLVNIDCMTDSTKSVISNLGGQQ